MHLYGQISQLERAIPCEDEDVGVMAPGAHVLEDLDAVIFGHVEVEDDQVKCGALDQVEGLLPVLDCEGFTWAGLQIPGE